MTRGDHLGLPHLNQGGGDGVDLVNGDKLAQDGFFLWRQHLTCTQPQLCR